MKAQVSTLYRKGKRVPAPKVAKTVSGDLYLSSNYDERTGRNCTLASVSNVLSLLLPCLYDAHCVFVSFEGFKLRGIEIVDGRETAQEWYCVPMSQNENTK